MDNEQIQVALVTGAARGIGRGIALHLAQKGMTVAVNYSRDQEGAQATVRQIESQGGVARAYVGDVSQPEVVAGMLKQIKRDLGPVGVLVNNAGITRDRSLMRMSLEDWNAVLGTNLHGAFYCIKSAALDMMKRGYGRIINIGSLSWYQGAPGQANYSAAKAGLVGLTRCLASELAGVGITVNVVVPGLIPTALLGQIPAEKLEMLNRSVPMKRLGTPDEVARVVGFLASEAAGYVTGQIISVDGGLSCTLGG